MRIELFGYYLYPAFFITVIGVPVLVTLLIIFLRRFKERKQVYSTSIITTWEKKHIPELLNKEIDESDSEEYSEIINNLKEYVQTCDYWNTDELLEINKDSIIILTSILFDEVKEKHASNPDKSVLLLHAIDNINGGIDYEMGKNFMEEDMSQLNNHEKMGVDEAKVLSLCETALNRVISEYVDLDSQKIPIVTEAISELIGVEREDLGSALRDVLHCIDFTELKESTFDMLELALIDMIDKIIESHQEDYFDQYYLSCFRTLACVIDRQLYNDILKTIEK